VAFSEKLKFKVLQQDLKSNSVVKLNSQGLLESDSNEIIASKHFVNPDKLVMKILKTEVKDEPMSFGACEQDGSAEDKGCKDFVIKDEQLVKLENEDESKTEIHFDDLPCKVEIKTENDITVKKELVKTENSKFQNGEFSKSEEDSCIA
jgi:hypothetical protein